MSRERWLFVIGVILLAGTNLLGSYFATADTFETALQIGLSAVVLMIVYGGLSMHVDSLTGTVAGLRSYIDTRLSGPAYYDSPDEVAHALTAAVKRSKTVFTVGGRARDKDYLDSIEQLVDNGGEYMRILQGDHILHSLHEHVDRLLSKHDTADPDSPVRVAWFPVEKYGNVTVTDAEVLVSGPSPIRKSPLQSILHIPDEEVASRFREWATRVYGAATPVTRGSALLTNLCVECSAVRSRVDDLQEEITRLLVGQRQRRPGLVRRLFTFHARRTARG